MSKVAIVPCLSYDRTEVREAVEKAVSLLGGWERFIKKEEKIILKPNLLSKSAPERACTTHPEVFRAAAKLLQEQGYGNLKYGDSPGNHLVGAEKTAESCGIKAAADELGIAFGDFEHGEAVDFPEGEVCRSFILCRAVIEADAVINLCKMKTHMLERITGAVKNTFGCVYGFNKGASHAKFPNADIFGRMIVDLNHLVKPRLHIMDAVTAMEGNGPQSGTPVKMGLILASEDPVALDGAFARLVHLEPQLVPTNDYGRKMGLGTYEDLEILTEDGVISIEAAVSKWGNPKFDVERNPEAKGELKPMRFLQPFLQKKPVVDSSLCVKCGICINSCPLEKKAIFFGKKKGGVPAYRYKDCIRCYCCQEMCPEKAIYVKTPKLVKLADRNWRI